MMSWRKVISLAVILVNSIPLLVYATPPSPPPCSFPINDTYTVETRNLPDGIVIDGNGTNRPVLRNVSAEFLIVSTTAVVYKFSNSHMYTSPDEKNWEEVYQNPWQERNTDVPLYNIQEVAAIHFSLTPGVFHLPFSIHAIYGGRDLTINGEIEKTIGQEVCTKGKGAQTEPTVWARLVELLTNFFRNLW